MVTVGSPAIRELRVDVRSHHRRHGRRIARFEARESSTFTPHEDCTFRHLRLTEIGNAISRHPFFGTAHPGNSNTPSATRSRRARGARTRTKRLEKAQKRADLQATRSPHLHPLVVEFGRTGVTREDENKHGARVVQNAARHVQTTPSHHTLTTTKQQKNSRIRDRKHLTRPPRDHHKKPLLKNASSSICNFQEAFTP